MPALESFLDELGLSSYERAAYRVLFTLHRAQASRIAEKSKVPQAKIYGVLKSLEEKGLVGQELSKTKTYALKDPHSSFSSIINRKQAGLRRLEDELGRILETYGGQSSEKKNESLEIMHGREKVLGTIDGQFISTKSFYYATAGFRTNSAGLREEVRKMIDRGVAVCFIGNIDSKNLWLAEKWAGIGVEIKHSAEVDKRVRFSVLDKRFATLTLKDEEYTTIVTNSLPIVLTIFDMFQYYWAKAVPLKDRKAQLPEVSIA
jgi:sugar-specific transcriptional regulator TrmB